MKRFLGDDFLLETKLAEELYHEHVRDLPIVDYHTHLPPEQIASDHHFPTLTAIWLEGDHYKWRAMRSNGVPEQSITGDASDWVKFEAWARTVPATLRNPLYHWTHMELKRPFGIAEILDQRSARRIYEKCNALLAEPAFSTQGLLKQFRVAVVCTTDDPADSLQHHEALARRTDPATTVYPTFRPDKAYAVDDPAAWNAWVARLEKASGRSVGSFDELVQALEARHGAFHDAGCRASDHGLEQMDSETGDEDSARRSFDRLRRGEAIDAGDTRRFRSALLHLLALLDHARGWVQQFHIGAMRNANTRRRQKLGPDTGFDSIADAEQARPLARFLDRLDQDGRLAKTILYNLNPRDNELFATMIGNFQDGPLPGKMQYGSAWWFLDQKDGMEAQMRALSHLGLFSRFVGMITDSRSFLSYSRHEYFRRLVCNLLGNDVRDGLLPDDRELLVRVAQAVAFHNARDYFGFPLGGAAKGAGG
jgi:glucuronate isomerase